jgi:hypothetical protein
MRSKYDVYRERGKHSFRVGWGEFCTLVHFELETQRIESLTFGYCAESLVLFCTYTLL